MVVFYVTLFHGRPRMASVARALGRIKQDLEPHLPPAAIEAACRAAGHAWRERKLGPVATVHLFVLQMLHANAAIRALRHLAGGAASASAAAYCRARARLPLAALQALLRGSADALRDTLGRECGGGECGGGGGGGGELTRWRGHRAFLVDATATAVPDTPALRRLFKQPTSQRPGCGLPVPKVLALFDAMTGLVVEAVAFCLFVNEAGKAWTLHPLLAAGDLLVGDRAFCSFAQLALLHARGAWGLFRVNRQIVSFRPHRRHYDRRKSGAAREAQRGRPRSRWVRRLGRDDQVVAWIRPRPKEGPRWMTRAAFAALPRELLVREVRYRVVERGRRTREVTVATTLLDPVRYPRDAVAGLYGVRWRVETHFGQLKTTLGLARLKCKTADGVRKELAAYCLAYNLVHAVMARAAAAQRTTPDRISFVDALRWLLVAAPGEAVPPLVVNPERKGRYCPRVVKHVAHSHQRMTRPRSQYARRPPPRKGKARA
jgi:hypothetical protein